MLSILMPLPIIATAELAGAGMEGAAVRSCVPFCVFAIEMVSDEVPSHRRITSEQHYKGIVINKLHKSWQGKRQTTYRRSQPRFMTFPQPG
jgi:hypothetical protein